MTGRRSTPGTVTVRVLKTPRITVRKLPNRPGHLRMTNGAKFRIRFLYGDYTKDDAEGDLRMREEVLGRDQHPLHPDRLVRLHARTAATPCEPGHVERNQTSARLVT